MAHSSEIRAGALVVGAGPAGMAAAEALAGAGRSVLLADRMPSPARKLLMAGKSGLNLAKDEPLGAQVARYGAAGPHLRPMLEAFGADGAARLAEGLGQEVFTGSSGRVFPRAMKASPLTRAWLERLGAMGVDLRRRWAWRGGGAFDTPEGPVRVLAPVTVLALGGASWRRLGSDGAWAGVLAAAGVPLEPFEGANVGLRVAWSAHMERHFGAPVKDVRVCAGAASAHGEIAVSRAGLEGGALYEVIPEVRRGAPLVLDLLPGRSAEAVEARLEGMPRKASRANRLRRLGLPPVKAALVMEFGGDPKAVTVRHEGLRDLDEAISVAGGVAWEGLTEDLEIRAMPGIYACGEMLDWEAPTGGYLLTACLATGAWAGRAAARAAAPAAALAAGRGGAQAP